jgi:catechol 2,3-dioxygenase-like lactoylglutathione lyase family enzyme
VAAGDLLKDSVERGDAGFASDQHRADQRPIEREMHGATLHRMAGIRSLVEVVLIVEDIDTSLGFYRDTLGLQPISPAELPVKFLRVGAERSGVPQQVVLIPRAMASEQPLPRSRRLHHIGLEVAPEDYELERQRLEALGFEIRSGEHPFMPVDAFYLDDPDGNEVEIATWRG